MVTASRLLSLYGMNHYEVKEASGYLLVGFKPGSVSFIAKEVWNSSPLTKAETEELYGELQRIGARYGCRYFRVIAHGGYIPEALSFELHGLTVSDETYLDSLASGRHIELFSHNERAYRAIEEGFKHHRIGAVVQATGTGKSFLLARYIVRHAAERILVVAPNRTILGEIRRAVGGKIPHVIYRTFQALTRTSGTERCSLRIDDILIDEFHHFGAEAWGEAVREIMSANPEARILGTSATPIRPEGMIDTVDVYFEGNLFYELSLPQAWYYGILPIPVLVQSVYGAAGQLDKLQKALDTSACPANRRKYIQKKLDAARRDFKTSWGAPRLIRQFLPPAVRKLLVFCPDKEELRQMRSEVMEWLKEAGMPGRPFEIHTDKSRRENERTLKAFREESEELHVLFSINMLIEGLHVEGIDAALFLRRTESYVVTLQQLGRCLKAGSEKRPVILDFVNNLSGKSVYDVLARDLERISLLRSPKGFIGVSDFQVNGFFSDIRKRVNEILAELEPWEIMYQRLLEYRAAEQDWPSVAEGKLGLWCHTQRVSRRQGTLPPGRIRRLEAIDFDWEQQDSRWEKNFRLLKAFYENKRRWPKRGEGEVSAWCNTQRQARKNGTLTKERIRRLDSIGFIWEYDREEDWQEKCRQLSVFYRVCHRWPKSTEGSLGAWCVTQRKMWKNGQLLPERKETLDRLGFIWSAEETWSDNLQKLEAFYKKYHRWPTSREGALGSWYKVQRQLYRNGRLSEERRRKLENVVGDEAREEGTGQTGKK